MMRVSFALALALILPITAWGQTPDQSANDWFRVSWKPSTHRVASRIEGHVYNDSPYRVTAVRLRVQGVDAETSFVVEAIPGAVTYRIAVLAFDVVSLGRTP